MRINITYKAVNSCSRFRFLCFQVHFLYFNRMGSRHCCGLGDWLCRCSGLWGGL